MTMMTAEPLAAAVGFLSYNVQDSFYPHAADIFMRHLSIMN